MTSCIVQWCSVTHVVYSSSLLSFRCCQTFLVLLGAVYSFRANVLVFSSHLCYHCCHFCSPEVASISGWSWDSRYLAPTPAYFCIRLLFETTWAFLVTSGDKDWVSKHWVDKAPNGLRLDGSCQAWDPAVKVYTDIAYQGQRCIRHYRRGAQLSKVGGPFAFWVLCQSSLRGMFWPMSMHSGQLSARPIFF